MHLSAATCGTTFGKLYKVLEAKRPTTRQICHYCINPRRYKRWYNPSSHSILAASHQSPHRLQLYIPYVLSFDFLLISDLDACILPQVLLQIRYNCTYSYRTIARRDCSKPESPLPRSIGFRTTRFLHLPKTQYLGQPAHFRRVGLCTVTAM